jgi:hypothetical protein
MTDSTPTVVPETSPLGYGPGRRADHTITDNPETP